MKNTHSVLKEHIISYIIISFCAAFALCFFAPMEIYLSNKDYFFFDGKEMLSFELLATILLSAVITVSLILTNRISQKLNSAFLTFGFSLVLAMYIQGNFLPNDYGALDGSAIIWSQYKLNGICSLVLFIITIVASFIIVAKCSNKNIIKVIRSVAVCWLLLQLMTLSTLFLQNNGLKKDNVYLSSTTNEMNFSADENIIVIMLDTFESGTLTEILKQDSDDKYHCRYSCIQW